MNKNEMSKQQKAFYQQVKDIVHPHSGRPYATLTSTEKHLEKVERQLEEAKEKYQRAKENIKLIEQLSEDDLRVLTPRVRQWLVDNIQDEELVEKYKTIINKIEGEDQ